MSDGVDMSDLDDGRITFGAPEEKLPNAAEKDPVCGMEVFPATAEASRDYRGTVYHFAAAPAATRSTTTRPTTSADR